MLDLGKLPVPAVHLVARQPEALVAVARWLTSTLGTCTASLEDFDLVVVPGGLNNYCFRLGGVLIKLYGQGTARLTDRVRERTLMEHICAKGPARTCKRLLATFDGGHVEEWLEGGTISFADMMTTHRDAIAVLLARLHSCTLPIRAGSGATGGGSCASAQQMVECGTVSGDTAGGRAAGGRGVGGCETESDEATEAFFDDMAAWAAALPPLTDDITKLTLNPPSRDALINEVMKLTPPSV